jgi:hypothetical protein
MQLHGIALSFHRQMHDASRKLFWPNIVMAVIPKSYPRFIKSGFNDYHGLECALDGGQFQAAVLTGCWAWRSSYCAGLR